MTDEEIIAQGQQLCKAYYIGYGFGESKAEEESKSVRDVSNHFAKQARALADMINAPTVRGQAQSGSAFLRKAEQLGEDAKASLEAEEKKPEANKKLISQWRFVVNCFFGATHKRGLIPDLKDAGPGAY